MHTIKDKNKLIARTKRIQGQVAALEKQLNDESNCTAILQQIAAIRGAVNGLMASVIEGHVENHIVEENDEEMRKKEAEVLLSIVKSYFK